VDLVRLPIGKVYKSIMDASGRFVALSGFHPAHGQLLCWPDGLEHWPLII
jgi:hypothetical protein